MEGIGLMPYSLRTSNDPNHSQLRSKGGCGHKDMTRMTGLQHSDDLDVWEGMSVPPAKSGPPLCCCCGTTTKLGAAAKKPQQRWLLLQ